MRLVERAKNVEEISLKSNEGMNQQSLRDSRSYWPWSEKVLLEPSRLPLIQRPSSCKASRQARRGALDLLGIRLNICNDFL